MSFARRGVLLPDARDGGTIDYMTDDAIHHRIQQLIDSERELRSKLGAGEIDASDEHAQLKDLETQLDQAWDLLRQRRAKREFDENPSDAQERSANVVEGYRN